MVYLYPIAYILFILPFTAWLGHELGRKYNLAAHKQWLILAFVIGVVSAVGFNYPDGVGNFLLHASGGVAATCLFVYLTKTLHIELNWRLASVALFAFVCMLGVINELIEYALDLLGAGVFSLDAHDTWRDLVANTTGAIVAWLAYSLFSSKKR